jgi:hypothetical protein
MTRAGQEAASTTLQTKHASVLHSSVSAKMEKSLCTPRAKSALLAGRQKTKPVIASLP